MSKVLLTTLCLLFVCSAAVAGPAYLITKPPVVGGLTGPDNDPLAAMGQWFIPRSSPLPPPGMRMGTTVRPFEFYDNDNQVRPGQPAGQGGGWASISAIVSGAVYYYDMDAGGGYGSGADGILDTFGVDITVTNDLPGSPHPGVDSINWHYETLPARPLYDGPMIDVKVTAEFSIDLNNGFPVGAPNPPYFPPGNIVYHAVNHQELSWYSYNQDPQANFWVPTWDLGNIPKGASATVEMQFYVGNGMLGPGLPLRAWLDGGPDLFYNRTWSLKISDWVSQDFGPGAMYDQVNEFFEMSNVGVFFVPEPTCLLLVLAGGAAVLRRRR